RGGLSDQGRMAPGPGESSSSAKAEIHIHNQGEDQAMKYLEEALGVSQKIKDRSMEGRTLWIWSQTLGKTGNLAGAVSRGQEAQKIYEKLKKSEASNIRAQIEKWSEN
ncbi:MAG: tetratricopeptide repeat protein, partial [Nitrospinaceae bacterium]|nr:tetratricopeptide repeat protein [Nitrospinaceae bacterium]